MNSVLYCVRARMNRNEKDFSCSESLSFIPFLCKGMFTLAYIIIACSEPLWEAKPSICYRDYLALTWAEQLAWIQYKAALRGANLSLGTPSLCVFMARNEFSSMRLAWQKGQVSHSHHPGLICTLDEGCVQALCICSSRIFTTGMLWGWSWASLGQNHVILSLSTKWRVSLEWAIGGITWTLIHLPCDIIYATVEENHCETPPSPAEQLDM